MQVSMVTENIRYGNDDWGTVEKFLPDPSNHIL